MNLEPLRPWPAAAIGLALTAVQAPALADVDCANITPIYDIQGTSHVSQYVGMEVETCGVVTAVAFNGYYLQDPAGDGNDATADGLFVFQFGNLPQVGELLRVRDIVTEFIPGGPSTGNLSITQL
jgi:predicted extracellular nuclease